MYKVSFNCEILNPEQPISEIINPLKSIVGDFNISNWAECPNSGENFVLFEDCAELSDEQAERLKNILKSHSYYDKRTSEESSTSTEEIIWFDNFFISQEETTFFIFKKI